MWRERGRDVEWGIGGEREGEGAIYCNGESLKDLLMTLRASLMAGS